MTIAERPDLFGFGSAESGARNQADWLKAWERWTSTLKTLRQQAKHPDFHRVPAPESKFELLSE
jgi:hypothetical protein